MARVLASTGPIFCTATTLSAFRSRTGTPISAGDFLGRVGPGGADRCAPGRLLKVRTREWRDQDGFRAIANDIRHVLANIRGKLIGEVGPKRPGFTGLIIVSELDQDVGSLLKFVLDCNTSMTLAHEPSRAIAAGAATRPLGHVEEGDFRERGSFKKPGPQPLS